MMPPRAPVPHVVRPRPPARTRRGRFLEHLGAALFAPILALAAFATLLASRMTMAVGTVVRRETRAGAGDTLRVISSQAFLVLLTDRGRTDTPIAVGSVPEFEADFGDVVSYGYGTNQLSAFFAEGGARAWIIRKVGASATKGTLTLDDRAGTPQDTMRIDAISAGDWSTDLKVQVADGTVADTFTLTLWLNQGQANERKEVYRNHATVAAAAAEINGRSKWATATDLGSATAYPARRPAVLAATALSAGTDDRASLTASDMVGALDLFPAELGPGVVLVPGYHGDDIGAIMAAHCLANGRDGFVHGDVDEVITDAIASALALEGTPGGEHVGWIHPWIEMDDPEGIGTVTVPPVGFAAGVRARAHQAEGPHRIPAGDDYPSRSITGLAETLTTDQINSANENHVSPIVARGSGATLRHELYGYRSLSDDLDNYYHLSSASTMAALAYDIDQAVQDYVFRPIDGTGKFETGLASRAEAVCRRYALAGALFPKVVDGVEIDPGFSVGVTTVPEDRQALVTVAARPPESAELIEIAVIKVPITASV